MIHVRFQDGGWHRLSPRDFISRTADGAQFPLRAVLDAGWEEAFAVRVAEPFVPPAGKRIVGPETFHEDEGTVYQAFDVEDIPPPTIEELDDAARLAAQGALLAISARRIIDDEAMSDDDRIAVGGLFPSWRAEMNVEAGDIRRHNGGLYRAAQAHLTQADWEPQTVPALWNAIVAPGTVGPWVQPAGAHDAYQVGDRVTHVGQTWGSTVADNVWEPGVHGWAPE